MADQDLHAKAEAIGNKWTSAWSQTDASVWQNIYAPHATYTDYAFFFFRRGHAGLRQHFNYWRGAHPDFRIEISEIWPAKQLSDGKMKCSIRTQNIGTFTNDLPSVPASGKKFNFYAVVDIVWDDTSGLIENIDEWYNRQFDAEKLMEVDQ